MVDDAPQVYDKDEHASEPVGIEIGHAVHPPSTNPVVITLGPRTPRAIGFRLHDFRKPELNENVKLGHTPI